MCTGNKQAKNGPLSKMTEVNNSTNDRNSALLEPINLAAFSVIVQGLKFNHQLDKLYFSRSQE